MSADRLIVPVVALCMLLCVALAVMAGPDAGWDLRNYHFYSGWIFLHGGGEQNIFPAQIQGWFNPVLDGALVGLMQTVPPPAVNLVIGAMQSLNIPLVYIILTQALRPVLIDRDIAAQRFILLAALAISLTGAMTLSELGSSFGDAVVSVFILAALAIVGRERVTGQWFILAGLALGIGCGLKLTNLVYLPGFALMFAGLGRPVARFPLFALGCGAGLLLGDGFWAWKLWSDTGNPVFPALNGIFHSPWLEPVSRSLDDRFAPRSLMAALRFPFLTASGGHPGAEVAFRDPRFALAILMLPLLLWRRPRGFAAALAVFFYVSYALWMAVFGIERYLVPLELLSGAILVLPLALTFKSRDGLIAIGIVTALVLLTTEIPDWDNRAEPERIGKGWFTVAVPAALDQPDEMFLMLGGDPLSYVIPFFRPDAQFVRMEGNLKLTAETGLAQRRRAAVTGHSGPAFTLGTHPPIPAQEVLLAGYGWRWRKGGCILLPTNIEFLFACPLERE